MLRHTVAKWRHLRPRPPPLAGFKGAYFSANLFTVNSRHVALWQRVRGVITRTCCINVLTYLLTYISSTIGCANFGPDWPLLFKVHEIWSVDS